MVFFSIIIPVYNVQDYLKRCVDSILIQNYKDFEILLINDGSIDNSALICDEYAKFDSRIKVLHKLNEGASAARNDGITNAAGNYIMFVDSDDYWEGTNALQSIFKRLVENKAELILFGYKILNINTGLTSTIKSNYDSVFLSSSKKNDSVKYLFENNLFPSSVWVIAVEREVLLKNDIYFEVGLIAEDIDFLIKLFSSISAIDSIEDIFYVYLKNRKDSVSNTSGKKGVESMLFILDKWVPKFLNNKDEISKYYLSFLAFHYSTVFLTFAYLEPKIQKELIPRLHAYFFMFKYTSSFKPRIINFILRLFGIENGSTMLRKMYNFIEKNSKKDDE